MKATVSRKASKQNAAASPNTGFAAHFVRQNATHFAKPEAVSSKQTRQRPTRQQ